MKFAVYRALNMQEHYQITLTHLNGGNFNGTIVEAYNGDLDKQRSLCVGV